MKELNINTKVGIVGSGTMGMGIAQVAATFGHNVFLYDINKDALENAKQKLINLFNRLVQKNKFTGDEAGSILNKINFVNDLNRLNECGFIVEAVTENLEVKQRLFTSLEKIVQTETVLATNTSSLSITSIASSCKDYSRIIGTHFFNPPPLMPLVEVVPGLLTSEEITGAVIKLMNDWKKIPVIAKDTPGFIVNRVARPFYGEALRILEEGIADAATIDRAMKVVGKFKLGPFELMDLIGNDVNYKVTETVFEQFYFDPRYKPSITQKRMIEANLLGRKTGRGFYDYSENAVHPEPNKDENLAIEIFFRILSMLINEAADAVFMNIAAVEEIDLAMTKGVNYPKGLLRWADEIGIEKVVKRLNLLNEVYGEDRYRVSPLLKRMAKQKQKFYNS